MQLYTNQILLEIHPVMNNSNTFAGEVAQRTLSWKGYSLYMYCVYRRTNTYWALSREDVIANTALTHNTYASAVEELVQKGYLVASPIEYNGKLRTKDTYKFLEDPSNVSDNPELVTKPVKPKKESKPKVDKPKKVSRKDQLVNYVNELTFTEDTKSSLFNWIFQIGLAKGVTVDQLTNKLKAIAEACEEDEAQIKQAIENAYLNGWFGFFKPSTGTNKTKTQKNNSPKPVVSKKEPVYVNEEPVNDDEPIELTDDQLAFHKLMNEKLGWEMPKNIKKPEYW